MPGVGTIYGKGRGVHGMLPHPLGFRRRSEPFEQAFKVRVARRVRSRIVDVPGELVVVVRVDIAVDGGAQRRDRGIRRSVFSYRHGSSLSVLHVRMRAAGRRERRVRRTRNAHVKTVHGDVGV